MPLWLEVRPSDQIDAVVVRLRRWRVEDVDVLFRLVSDNLEHLRPWMPWARELSFDEQHAFLQRMQEAWEQRTDFAYAVTLPSSEPIGSMGLHAHEEPGTLEIGYWIGAAHAGRGYATSAAGAMTRTALALPGVERVEIHCDEANKASAAVPRKLGFTLVEVITRDTAAPAETGRGMIWAVGRDWLTQA